MVCAAVLKRPFSFAQSPSWQIKKNIISYMTDKELEGHEEQADSKDSTKGRLGWMVWWKEIGKLIGNQGRSLTMLVGWLIKEMAQLGQGSDG